MRKIIIDTDPGQDDAAAIMLALASPEIEVLGITVVAGNVPLEFTTRNARIICEWCGKRDTKIFAGADRPLARKLVSAEHIHGKTGLDGVEVFEPRMRLQERRAKDFLVDTLMREPAGTVTLCTLGALTNVASALQAEPMIAARVKELVMMGGGGFEGGNITPAAEFNVFVDPEAAAIVFGAGIPLTMMTLDVTHKVLTTKARIDRIAAIGNPAAKALAAMLSSRDRYDTSKYGSDGAPLHDPTVIARLLKPELFSGRECNVEIETQSELTRGMTVIDWWQVSGRPHNACVMRNVDVQGFFELLFARLERLPTKL